MLENHSVWMMGKYTFFSSIAQKKKFPSIFTISNFFFLLYVHHGRGFASSLRTKKKIGMASSASLPLSCLCHKKFYCRQSFFFFSFTIHYDPFSFSNFPKVEIFRNSNFFHLFSLVLFRYFEKHQAHPYQVIERKKKTLLFWWSTCKLNGTIFFFVGKILNFVENRPAPFRLVERFFFLFTTEKKILRERKSLAISSHFYWSVIEKRCKSEIIFSRKYYAFFLFKRIVKYVWDLINFR